MQGQHIDRIGPGGVTSLSTQRIGRTGRGGNVPVYMYPVPASWLLALGDRQLKAWLQVGRARESTRTYTSQGIYMQRHMYAALPPRPPASDVATNTRCEKCYV